jgi:MFS family permease
MFRGGAVLGPMLTAGLLAIVRTPASAFWITVAFTVGTAAVLLFMPDPDQSFGQVRAAGLAGPAGRMPEHTAGEIEAQQETHGLFRTISRNWHILIRLGVATGVVAALRAGRSVLLPLWAVSIGVSTSDTALVIGVASGLDFALFFVSGQIMDRFGRLSAIVPSMLGMSLPLIVLAFTHDAATAALWFVITALLMGVGNGLGAGINLTLASDLAPKGKPAPFLGAFRFTTDAGAATAPLVLSGLIGVASISIAAGSLGVLGLIGVAMMLRWVPRLVPYRGPKRAS